ncbi:uncharacterized protein SCHCODRAFT_02515678 [Schizophyllum commune H4-8]|uniref:Expressed protein n=1 Tax=Schizophyllum commune (strain H4-8 / FGSC 9210) TaxID=578458 RepID=D8QFS1_SCHCM|nr:uncharacterized protein SCHCODRAFT_02515678 [Schizophyllum commune H4-8]KAI5887760.1 hypothetical protein SCHCODRAFT_02515678 [Schizophyllum commune H4-8]
MQSPPRRAGSRRVLSDEFAASHRVCIPPINLPHRYTLHIPVTICCHPASACTAVYVFAPHCSPLLVTVYAYPSSPCPSFHARRRRPIV